MNKEQMEKKIEELTKKNDKLNRLLHVTVSAIAELDPKQANEFLKFIKENK